MDIIHSCVQVHQGVSDSQSTRDYPQSSLPYQLQTLIKENIRPRPKNLFFFFSWWPQIRDLCAEFLRLLKLRHKLVFGRSPRSWSVSLARHILWVTSLVFLYCSSKSQERRLLGQENRTTVDPIITYVKYFAQLYYANWQVRPCLMAAGHTPLLLTPPRSPHSTPHPVL